MENVIPYGKYIVLKPIKKDDNINGIVTEIKSKTLTDCIVIGIGDDCECSIGDKVMAGIAGATEVSCNGENGLMMHEDKVLFRY